MPFSGLSGQSGGIADSVIRAKYEVTNYYENPETFSDYFRDTLRDIRPDEPFMESDQTRRDNHSEERLSLRFTGHRTGEVPDHSEAFLELTERDPRGTALEPNFREAYKQGMARKDYIKFYPDDDMSVTEREKRPQQLISQMREQQESIKQRLKIFSTSKDAYAAARNFKFSPDSQYNADASMGLYSIGESQAATYRNYTTDISNQWPLGWTTTTDNEFQIAQYGNYTRGVQPGDIAANRHDYDTEMNPYFANFQDQRVSMGLASLMKATLLAKMQAASQYMGVENQATPSAYLPWQDPRTNQREALTERRRVAAFRDQSTMAAKGKADPLMAHAPLVHLSGVEVMSQATRASNKEQRRELQETLMTARMNKSFADVQHSQGLKANAKLGRNHEAAQSWVESMNTAQLALKAPSQGDQVRKGLVGEGYKSQSTNTLAQTGQAPKRRTTSKVEDQAHQTHGTHDAMRAPVGSKYMREQTDNTLDVAEVNDR